jgi:hypothetical protein
MDTLTIATVAKIVTDYVMKISGWLKLSIPGFAVHFLVMGITTGIMYGYSKVNGQPFNFLETLKAGFSAIGLDQFVNHVTAEPTVVPTGVITNKPV